MNNILHGSTQNTTIEPLYDENLAEIKRQISRWDETFGNAKISQYLFDVAFNRLYESEGFEFANDLLTETRYALRRSEGSTSLDWRRRCKQQAKAALQIPIEEKAKCPPVVENAFERQRLEVAQS